MWSKSAVWFVRTPWPIELVDSNVRNGAMAR